ncbi:Flexible cuticle protein 12 [Eumeta japonica]|uniref:Flexible cuticle protein 12 n=1 Tax=Eumeta variegata TaxID=151549 RepID=A0A4C1YAS2_EUMVA|nr:Flexible cuticle protein 12 [Eumeta japonica]
MSIISEENFYSELIALALVAAAAAAPAPQRPQRQAQNVDILRYDTNNAGDGSYDFDFELSDGTKHQQQGQVVNAGTDNESISVRGSYAWVGPDGVTYVVTYVADENGFQPTIEQGPGGGVPPAVVASLLG